MRKPILLYATIITSNGVMTAAQRRSKTIRSVGIFYAFGDWSWPEAL